MTSLVYYYSDTPSSGTFGHSNNNDGVEEFIFISHNFHANAKVPSGSAAPDPNPPPQTRRGRWVHQYTRNERNDLPYSHPRYVP